MRRAVYLLALMLSLPLSAQVVKPIRYTWIASSCTRWNCAAAALVLADGEPTVIVLPTGLEDRPWLILRRVEEGSVFVPEDEPFSCQVFHDIAVASAAFGLIEDCHGPLILNVPDGRAVVASLKKCEGSGRRRAVR